MRGSRLLIILSIFLCIKLFSNGATINKNFNSEEEVEEAVANETRATLPVEAFERSLNYTTRNARSTDSRNITSTDVKSQRRKRDVVTDEGPLSGFAIYDAMSDDGKSLRREGHVTKKHGKRRRHRRCKKRFGCSRSGHRNNNNRKKKHNGRKKKKDYEDVKIILPIEPRKWFQYQSHNNRNLQTRVLVGNRPLALFRKQLAAAAAADAIKSSTAVTDRSIDLSSTKINDFLIDTTSRRPHTPSTNSTLKFSSKHKNKNTKDKSGGKNDKKKKNKHEKLDEEKNVAKVTPEVSSEINVTEHQHNSSIIEDTNRSDLLNFEQQTIVVKRVPRTKSMDAK